MNRRTFLQLAGATIAVMTATSKAESKPKLQRISFNDRKPKIGQKYIILFTKNHMESFSESYQIVKASAPDLVYGDTLLRYKKYFSMSQGLTHGRFYAYYPDNISEEDIREYTKITKQWVTKPIKELISRKSMFGTEGCPIIDNGMFWLPIKNERPESLPKELPTLPKIPVI